MSDRLRRSLTPKARDAFLEALAAGWTVAHAATRAGHGRQRFYEERSASEEFATAWDDAIEAGTEVLEDELHRRAVDGWDEDSFDGDGKLMRRVRRYSPALLIFSLKARRPDVYRDNIARVELTGRDGGPVELNGYEPPTLGDVLRLARELGLAEVVDGEASEVRELPAVTA